MGVPSLPPVSTKVKKKREEQYEKSEYALGREIPIIAPEPVVTVGCHDERIGLSLEYVRLYGNEIELHSPNNLTCFQFRLPLNATKAEDPRQASKLWVSTSCQLGKSRPALVA